MTKRRRKWLVIAGVCVLAVCMAGIALLPRNSRPLGQFIGFLRGAEPFESDSDLVAINTFMAAAGPTTKPARIRKELYRLSLSFEEVKRTARAEFLHGSIKSSHGVSRNRDYWSVHLGGQDLQVMSRPDPSGVGTEVMVSSLDEASLLDKVVLSVKKVFGR